MNTCSYYKSLYEYLFLFAFNFLAETFLRLAETFLCLAETFLRLAETFHRLAETVFWPKRLTPEAFWDTCGRPLIVL